MRCGLKAGASEGTCTNVAVVMGLLQHESKMSVLNFTIKKHAGKRQQLQASLWYTDVFAAVVVADLGKFSLSTLLCCAVLSIVLIYICGFPGFDSSLKAKQNLLLRAGFRQWVSRGILSEDSTGAHKNKYLRFLHTYVVLMASLNKAQGTTHSTTRRIAYHKMR